MRIELKLNNIDNDMVEMFTTSSTGNIYLMSVFHIDCIDDKEITSKLEEMDTVKAEIKEIA